MKISNIDCKVMPIKTGYKSCSMLFYQLLYRLKSKVMVQKKEEGDSRSRYSVLSVDLLARYRGRVRAYKTTLINDI